MNSEQMEAFSIDIHRQVCRKLRVGLSVEPGEVFERDEGVVHGMYIEYHLIRYKIELISVVTVLAVWCDISYSVSVWGSGDSLKWLNFANFLVANLTLCLAINWPTKTAAEVRAAVVDEMNRQGLTATLTGDGTIQYLIQ